MYLKLIQIIFNFNIKSSSIRNLIKFFLKSNQMLQLYTNIMDIFCRPLFIRLHKTFMAWNIAMKLDKIHDERIGNIVKCACSMHIHINIVS